MKICTVAYFCQRANIDQLLNTSRITHAMHILMYSNVWRKSLVKARAVQMDNACWGGLSLIFNDHIPNHCTKWSDCYLGDAHLIWTFTRGFLNYLILARFFHSNVTPVVCRNLRLGAVDLTMNGTWLSVKHAKNTLLIGSFLSMSSVKKILRCWFIRLGNIYSLWTVMPNATDSDV